MYTDKSQKLLAGQQYLQVHAAHCIAYAQQDPEFAISLAAAVLSQNWKVTVGDTSTETHCSEHLLPLDQTDAVTTARWILQTLQTHPEYKSARSTLTAWAQNYESPKDVVLGIVGLAIIGPTLGIISSKKKKKRKSQLIVEDSYLANLSKNELAKLCTNLTQSVIAQETRLAGGNVYNLHPDSAAWCIEEALTEIYTDSRKNIAALLETITLENLSHTVEKDSEGNIVALVISPSVNDSLVEESDAQKL